MTLPTPQDWAIDSEIVQFFADFYKTSDTPSVHEDYAHQFTPDAVFILASKTSTGYAEILATRCTMWAGVLSRKHTVTKIFPFGTDAHEFMLCGIVKYTSKIGVESEKDWAARADVTKGADGKWRMEFYQVYLDTGASTE